MGQRSQVISGLPKEVGPAATIATAVLWRALNDLRLGGKNELRQDAWQFLQDWRGEAWADAADLDIRTIRRLAWLVRVRQASQGD